jgi:hypothetical protein
MRIRLSNYLVIQRRIKEKIDFQPIFELPPNGSGFAPQLWRSLVSGHNRRLKVSCKLNSSPKTVL